MAPHSTVHKYSIYSTASNAFNYSKYGTLLYSTQSPELVLVFKPIEAPLEMGVGRQSFVHLILGHLPQSSVLALHHTRVMLHLIVLVEAAAVRVARQGAAAET